MSGKLLVFLAILAPILAQQKCGQTPISPNLNSTGKIVGGTIAEPYSWPWQVVWCSNGWFGCDLECGGSVIGTHWVMTAGHCVDGNVNNPGGFRVKTGVYDERKKNEVGEVVHEVKKIYLHPKYQAYPDPLWDIALIEMVQDITFGDHVQPICLPTHDNATIVEPNTAWGTGWGTTNEGGDISNKLRQVNVPFVNYKTCEDEYPGDITEQVMVCAGKAGKDTCQGDSGGPLVVKSAKGSWFQYGITSFGAGCAEYKFVTRAKATVEDRSWSKVPKDRGSNTESHPSEPVAPNTNIREFILASLLIVTSFPQPQTAQSPAKTPTLTEQYP
uniref:Peptidase S1 domain-containing protein n=1 Tax=Panagrolaimus sp. JU765 TaxID=591449 RepID=A0AC34PYZ5_9BILA